MSFLDELRSKKHTLRPTSTILTHLDGQKFIQCGPETTPFHRKKFGFVVDTKPDNVPAKITDFIYLGSQDCCDSEILRNYCIENVLSVGIEVKCGKNCKFVECLDLPETDLEEVLAQSVDFIENAVQRQSNILVHCNAGVSRSASIVIGYLILVRGYNFLDAYNIVKNARSCVRPNDGFVTQLRNLTRS
ncbi:dual specificity protein phosphatase 19 [Tribolium madens]|uniref:dual specificity protein phosphatase 19 n=1 Tax=Tribolium madens TaxID=41895 RepID=UPI001CF72D19|nr:dual specificity protein phosphatase 19 [Tribolium madens]